MTNSAEMLALFDEQQYAILRKLRDVDAADIPADARSLFSKAGLSQRHQRSGWPY
jgi:hypothetical protein